MGPERLLETKFKKYVEEHGGICLKQQGERGIPDRLVIFKHAYYSGGGMYFAEFKSPKGHLSKAQVVQHERLQKLGIVVMVFDDYDTATAFHRRAMRHRPEAAK